MNKKNIYEIYSSKVAKHPCCISGREECVRAYNFGNDKNIHKVVPICEECVRAYNFGNDKNIHKVVPICEEIYTDIHSLKYRHINRKWNKEKWVKWVVTKNSLKSFFKKISDNLNKIYFKESFFCVKHGKQDYNEIFRFVLK